MIERRVLRLLLGRLAAMLVASAVVSLVPLAHASPPDPTWIAGLYDDADHDDAVIAITDASAFPARDVAAILPAILSPTAIALSGPGRPGNPSRICLLDRSPPLRSICR